MHPYENQFAPDNVYGHAFGLLEKFDFPKGGVHLDFGCGFGSIAEPIRDRLGLRYIGLDVLEEGLDSLKARGFDVMYFDLRDPSAAVELLERWLPNDVQIAAITMLDTLEHVAEPRKALGMLRMLALRHGCPLVLSVPNVAHRDVGFKLAMGEFEYTESGILDHTHFQYFTERNLAQRMKLAGWHQIDERDVLLETSDQAFPGDHPLLSPGTPISGLLRGLRKQTDSNGRVNQFVRAYLPSAPAAPPVTSTQSEYFLTVVTRTQGERIESLREAMLCLAAQSCQNFEVIVVGHKLDLQRQLAIERVIADQYEPLRKRIRLVKVDDGERAAPLNAGFEHANGRYVAMFDDDDLVFGHWVETFKKLAEKNPGKLLRATCVSQQWDKLSLHERSSATRSKSGYHSQYPESFDLFDHLVENRSPLHSLAFPVSLYRDLGFRFDEALTTAEDWDFIMRVCHLAGVVSSAEVTCVYRRWENAASSYTIHDQSEWDSNYQHTLRKLDAMPFLLPPGGTCKIRTLLAEADEARRRLGVRSAQPSFSQGFDVSDYAEALRWRLYELVNSKSWRYTKPLRAVLARLRGGAELPEMMIWRFSVRDLEHLIAMVENSRSWKVTAVFRSLACSVNALRQ